jgi:predicted NUDIX family phosphoesterase
MINDHTIKEDLVQLKISEDDIFVPSVEKVDVTPDEYVLCFPGIYIDPPEKDTKVVHAKFSKSFKNDNIKWWKTIAENFFYDTCYEAKLSKDIPAMFIPRSSVEYLPLVKQAVVGILIHSKTRVFLMKCLKGGMKGHYTMLEGHVAIPINTPTTSQELKDAMNMPLKKLLRDNAVREMNEEIRVSHIGAGSLVSGKPFSLYPTWISYMNEEIGTANISAHHVGFIYTMYISDELIDNGDLVFESNEECNELVVIEKNDINDEFLQDCDTWLQDVLKLVLSY